MLGAGPKKKVEAAGALEEAAEKPANDAFSPTSRIAQPASEV
jgi:hypothetical protein